MSATPIFDQLCRELGDPTEPEVSAEVIDTGPDAVAEPEPALNPDGTAAVWSAPGERVA